MGKDGFIWFQGVVEGRNDPLMLGRVRVRILGWHTEDKTHIPTGSLPWAHVIQPITSAAISGVGETPLGPVEGTWVIGFFRDGLDGQHPIIMGTIGGKPEASINTNEGFNDPNGVYPKYFNEPDTNRLARNENTENTLLTTKTENRKLSISIANGSTWNQPESPFSATYPKNHVRESESGHVLEIDDTPNAERLHRWHKAGSFDEIGPDGTRVVQVVGKNYRLVADDENIYVEGAVNITSTGKININPGETVEIEGDVNVTGTLTATVDVIANNVSLDDHTHGGVVPGKGNTFIPNKIGT
tara:strand:- start:4511 stop:5410 length:900 start_codon:yes stop_codon:yes gene_type:complete